MDIAPIRRSIPVLGEVRAGVWRQIPDEPSIEETLGMEVPGYESANLFALRVAGRSMDMYYADGAYVVVAHPAETGLQVGDHVVVRRTDRAGKVETTLKELTQRPGGEYYLEPRSTDPTQEALPVMANRDSDEGCEIIGVVVATYANARRGRGPLVSLEP